MSKIHVILIGLLILGCSNESKEKEVVVLKEETPKVNATIEELQISAPEKEIQTPEIVPQSTFTIRLDSSIWIIYNNPHDKTQNSDTLRLYPDSTYTVNEFAWYFKTKDDMFGEGYYYTYEGTYTVEGDILNLYTQTRNENRNHSTLLVSDTTLQHTKAKYLGGPLRKYTRYDLITPEMKREHRRLRNSYKDFINAKKFVELNSEINSVEDVTRLFGAPLEVVGSLNEKIAQEDPYNTHTCLKYDGLTIQLIGQSIWLYEYSSPEYDIDTQIKIGSLKDSVISIIGEAGTVQYNVHWYSSDNSSSITHTSVTGSFAAAATEHPYMDRQNQLFAAITYNDTTDRISTIRFEQVYIKPH
ncbi:MAG: hypothetical protein HOB84_11685 [Candidatus Marinimicrobia bacterium]|jgi:hypothetical protein|nr:hypothetical protein [Candidatus Neomarinimicrobiota bacterium]MBT4361378.1 hypothetical protein [Candidatus Neomarinimicrobiota bacterium]MBT4715423.1 hypothetical protein [Candidatus Neomarinimicrobiota bacterium]MBT4994060.1 hypothetical protein [Candidatus Neomarinimicrobiota bacterium]MBT5234434.1 hypothetical protein [Candidatus Neomarinimicrobiota bacterium]